MADHSIIPPSSAGIWGAPNGCTGWVSMSQQFPETEETEDAKEGTASHEIGARLINNQTVGNINGYAKNFVDQTASNGVIFTEEMYRAAKIYADDVGEIMRSAGVFGGRNIGIEQAIEAKRIHDLSFGTVDAYIFDRQKGALYIWDYKFGYEVVEAFENWQTINYAAGIFERLELNDGIIDQYITVHIRIIQPRAYHRDGPIREWVVKGSDLRAHFNTLEMNAAEALGPNAICRSGSHCKHCSARHACEAVLTAGMLIYEVARQPIPFELSPTALGVQLLIIRKAKEKLNLLESGIEEQTMRVIKAGKIIPNFNLVQGKGNEKWTKPVAEILALGALYDKDLKKPDEAITPNQARQKGMDPDLIASYSDRPFTGLKLVEDNGNKAKLLFGES